MSSILRQEQDQQEAKTFTEDANPRTSWMPIVFLGIFPIVMSAIVVFTRQDLLQDLQEERTRNSTKEIGRFQVQRPIDSIDKGGQQPERRSGHH